MFSFVLLDTRDKSFIAARDAIGITPLYLGWGHDGMWLHTFTSSFLLSHFALSLQSGWCLNLLNWAIFVQFKSIWETHTSLYAVDADNLYD